MMAVIPALLALATSPGGCQLIRSDRILARDVAAVVPAFAQVPADFPLGYVMTSGEPRILRGVDLQRIAKNQRFELDQLPDVCFARETFVPKVEQIRETMLAELKIVDAKIEFLSWSQHPAPTGELVFPLSGLQPSAQSDALWRGYVRYGAGLKFPVWAKVRVTATTTRAVATANIQPGKPILASQVRLENCEDSPLDETVARNLEDVVGLVAKSSVHAGSPIRKAQIERPPDVARGDSVMVQVFVGGAYLKLEGRAETNGVTGSTILVRNLSSGKDFRAQVTGKGQAQIQ
jgi:flagella basal body P-ring formation protein FlgA